MRCWSLVGRKERKGEKRENEKGEWDTWGERFASNRARMKRPPRKGPPLSSHQSLNALHLGTPTAKRPGGVSIATNHSRRSVTSQARFSCRPVTSTSESRSLLPISQCRGPGRIPRSLKTSTLSSPCSAMPLSMPWAGGASIGSTDSPRLLLQVGSPTPPALAT